MTVVANGGISWMPPWLEGRNVTEVGVSGSDERAWTCMLPTAEGWRLLGAGLRRAQRALLAMPIGDIVAAIDATAKRWCDQEFEPRRNAAAAASAATGFSREVVERSFDVELRNYRASSLLATLRRDLGNEARLDGFAPSPSLGGHSMVIGPTLCLAILTGNVPALPALPIVRALLVKSAVIAKLASGEPTFAARFVETLAEVEPRFGEAIAVTYWPREDEASLESGLAQADTVIAYGGLRACASVRSRIHPNQRYIEHGHRLSVAVLSQRYLRSLGVDAVARRVASDASMFNQQACIAPQAVLVEGGGGAAHRFAQALAEAMEAYASGCPLGTLDDEQVAALQLHRAARTWLAAAGGDHAIWMAPNLDWTVVASAELEPATWLGNRTVQVVPIADLAEVVPRLGALGGHLQNVGLGAVDKELWTLSQALAHAGACRICEPGRMSEPSLMWKHDGRSTVGELVRWCDVEMHDVASAVEE